MSLAITIPTYAYICPLPIVSSQRHTCAPAGESETRFFLTSRAGIAYILVQKNWSISSRK